MSNSSYNSRELLKLLADDGWVVVRIKGDLLPKNCTNVNVSHS